ncbi:hypothetical protein GCM10025868_15180 [Angustibacter aerolatus]|uniref:Uncharacterized protein n=1 Tax=Angustibacter aerolatus TaxID=1162965 RepID=A0ABQ6JFR3_9ACTN|nr:hypothetical protein GCM10025868_15180 [Angustibacter aerolatus]
MRPDRAVQHRAAGDDAADRERRATGGDRLPRPVPTRDATRDAVVHGAAVGGAAGQRVERRAQARRRDSQDLLGVQGVPAQRGEGT